MESSFDNYQLEDIARDHRIGAGVFVPFVIARLAEDRDATAAKLKVRLQDVGAAGETERGLDLRWFADSIPTQPLGVQDHTVTEWAACGVACAVLACYTGLQIRDVSTVGDRFDYWVQDGGREYGLEVSGTMTGDIEARHRAKVRQCRSNPYGVDGYVVVTGFLTREVICSLCRF